jgi:NAD(P)-dependent dehydrogenase (short-subunit alcohol dehydrogenase family)
MKLEGQTALVTGGAVRIGRAIVEALAERGCRVVVHYHRSGAAALRLVAELRRQGREAWAVGGPLGTERAAEALLARAWRVAGRVDTLVNNAAGFTKEPLRDCTEKALLGMLRPNLLAPVLLTRAFAARTRRGQVVNLLDRRIAGLEPGCVPYLLSKKALAAFTGIAALELAPGIRVNAVAPGPVLPPPGRGGRYRKDRAGRVPLGRRVSPEDVAAAVVALLELENVTGQVLFVDGGQSLLGAAV